MKFSTQFFSRKKVSPKNMRVSFSEKSSLLHGYLWFREAVFWVFDGFAKLHPPTLWFRETIMVSRNRHGFDDKNLNFSKGSGVCGDNVTLRPYSSLSTLEES
jgi:hypothetical protein